MTLPDQPQPTPATGDVWAELIAYVKTLRPADAPLVAAMEERRRLGIERYGVPLQRDNGRDHLIDAKQELLDAAVYLWAAGRERSATDVLFLLEWLP